MDKQIRKPIFRGRKYSNFQVKHGYPDSVLGYERDIEINIPLSLSSVTKLSKIARAS